MLLYSLLHLTGYDLPLEELKKFRQWNSKTPGHPEFGLTAGVETTSGPLGQDFANGVGMAIAERYLAARFNRPGHVIVDHYTYGIVSDGDLMEGISHEAASLAGHLGLGKLIYFYDDNHISIEGSTDLAFSEDRIGRFATYGWYVQQVADGNDVAALGIAVAAAQKDTKRPFLIAVRTHIGYGSPNKQDKASAHGEPLGPEEIKLTKKNLKWPLEPSFLIPEEARRHFRKAIDKGRLLENRWQAALTRRNGPVALVLTRQNVPALDREKLAPADGLQRGAYILGKEEESRPGIILIASGSEVAIALEAAEKIKEHNLAVRVVSRPSWELFEEQSQNYRHRALPPAVSAKIAIEAGSPLGWHRHVGEKGIVVALDHFGASAPYKVLYKKFGLAAEQVVGKALALAERVNT